MKKFIVEKFLLEIDRLDASEIIDEHLSECDMANLMHHHFGEDDDKQPDEDGIDKSSFEHHGKDDEDEIDLDKGEDWGSKELDSDKELNNINSDSNSSFESSDDITDEDPYEYEDKDDIEDELTEAFGFPSGQKARIRNPQPKRPTTREADEVEESVEIEEQTLQNSMNAAAKARAFAQKTSSNPLAAKKFNKFQDLKR